MCEKDKTCTVQNKKSIILFFKINAKKKNLIKKERFLNWMLNE